MTTFTSNEILAIKTLINACLSNMGGTDLESLDADPHTWVSGQDLIDAGWSHKSAAGTFAALAKKGAVVIDSEGDFIDHEDEDVRIAYLSEDEELATEPAAEAIPAIPAIPAEPAKKARASNRIKRVQPASDYRAMDEMGRTKGDNNFCSVVALAFVSGLSFLKSQIALEELGRMKGKGMNNPAILEAMKVNGVKLSKVEPESFIAKYPKPHKQALKHVTTHHPRRFAEIFAEGTYVMFTSDHVAVCVDGELKDWSVNNALRVKEIYKVTS